MGFFLPGSSLPSPSLLLNQVLEVLRQPEKEKWLLTVPRKPDPRVEAAFKEGGLEGVGFGLEHLWQLGGVDGAGRELGFFPHSAPTHSLPPDKPNPFSELPQQTGHIGHQNIGRMTI